MISIPVYNEQNNIGDLLGVLEKTRADQRIEKICIVSSSTDQTDNIVREHSVVDDRIELLEEGKRRGKASAWNTLIRYAEDEGFDTMV